MLSVADNVPYKSLNTMGIEGYARRYAEWEEPSDLYALSEPEVDCPQPVIQIGAGSNLLFPDGRLDATLLVSRYKDTEVLDRDSSAVTFRVGAGLRLDDFIAGTAAKGLWGLENLSHIPGTVGAAAVQNVGAYGVEFADCLESVKCFDLEEQRFTTFAASELKYGYRDSAFKHAPLHRRMIITDVTLRLSVAAKPHLDYGNLRAMLPSEHPTPTEIRQAIIATRRAKLPEVGTTGSCGSFFKNPVVEPSVVERLRLMATSEGIDTAAMPAFQTADGRVKLSAAWLIDRAGLKGYADGNAGCWPTQPLVIANLTGRATSEDVIRVAGHISNVVLEKFGVELTREVEYL